MTSEMPKNPLSAKVAGKSVVYVGPAPILVGRGLGEFVVFHGWQRSIGW